MLDAPGGEHFTQTTIFARAAFPTFVTKLGTQSFVFHTHMVLTAGDTAPPQRFAYLGGSGTLPTFDILSEGGDQLVFLEGLYNFPIQTLHVPFLGTPVITVREMLGEHGRRKPGALRQQHRRAPHARPVQRRDLREPGERRSRLFAGAVAAAVDISGMRVGARGVRTA